MSGQRVTVEGSGAWLVAAALLLSTWIGVHTWDQHERRTNLYRCAELNATNPDIVCPTPSQAKP